MSGILENEKRIKCLVWDLDQTLWSGILLEGDLVDLRPEIRDTIIELDQRGILQSIASQNHPEAAEDQLRALGLFDYFVHPQMSLTADKPSQISKIADQLNLQLEHVAFIDDDPSQRAYVAYALPEVTVLEASEASALTRMPIFAVERLTQEASRRREFYLAEVQRQAAERDWDGKRLDFLRSCKIVLKLRPAVPRDTSRIAELVERTNQLNTSAQQLTQADITLRTGAFGYRLTVAEMFDRFGDYGTVGALIHRLSGQEGLIELLLVSCRAMGRGVGETLLCHTLQQAQAYEQQCVHALYRRTEYNRAMQLLLVTNGFKRGREQDGMVTFTHNLEFIPDYPAWLNVQIT
jgi:FkbH-like protein